MLRRGLLVLPIVLVSACGALGGTRGGGDAAAGRLVVLAAASLRESMVELERAFERASPGTDVVVTLDGSSALATAILEGVPGDVFVAADDATMRRARAGGTVAGTARAVATSSMQIVVAEGNPQGIARLEDLGRGVVVALCEPQVPCGAYAEQVFARAGLPVPGAGREANVKAVVTKVQLGEADAGLVYRTDVRAATGVEGVGVSPAANVEVTYLAAVLDGAGNRDLAHRFVEFMSGREGRAVFGAAGFGLP